MGKMASSEFLARAVVTRLQGAGFEAYYAGGCVRDMLMGRMPSDYDVATAATPEVVLKLFPRSQQVGVAFGVVLVRDRQGTVEVATFRTEGAYSDGRHPDAVAFSTAEADAARRDFTCNGLFFDPLADKLLDFVGGQADIGTRTLRAIGDPARRFGEDHLRLLRAVRFAAKLGFAIEPATHAAILDLQDRIVGISRERIGEEVRMMLEHPARAAAMTLLAGYTRLYGHVLGDLPRVEAWPRVTALAGAVSRAVALAAVVLDARSRDAADAAGQAERLRERLVLSNEETEALAWMLEQMPVLRGWADLTKAPLKRLMAHKHWPGLAAVFCAEMAAAGADAAPFAARVETMRAEGVAPSPWVTGDTLIRLGVRPGPQFRVWLEALYDRQLEGELASREAALEAARALVAGAAPRGR